jgi:hypothetical protein
VISVLFDKKLDPFRDSSAAKVAASDSSHWHSAAIRLVSMRGYVRALGWGGKSTAAAAAGSFVFIKGQQILECFINVIVIVRGQAKLRQLFGKLCRVIAGCHFTESAENEGTKITCPASYQKRPHFPPCICWRWNAVAKLFTALMP